MSWQENILTVPFSWPVPHIECTRYFIYIYIPFSRIQMASFPFYSDRFALLCSLFPSMI